MQTNVSKNSGGPADGASDSNRMEPGVVLGLFSIPFDVEPTSSRRGHVGADRGRLLKEFLAGPENALLRVAADSFAQSDRPYNPLVLCGPSSVGKSHLARGLERRWRSLHPRAKTVVTTGADFARDFATALQNDDLRSFRRKSAATSLFVLDDLGQLATKRAAQRELALAIDGLLDRSARVLITCSRLPSQIDRLSPTLVGRLLAGLTITLMPPGPDVRREVLRRLAARYGLNLTEPAVRVLADGTPGTVPQLNNLLLQLQTHAEGREPINGPAARRFVAERSDRDRPSIHTVARLTAKYFRIRLADIRGAGRRRAVVQARSTAMYLARQLTGTSLKQIGHYFGRRDHTTVLHACRKMERLLQNDLEIRQSIEALYGLLVSA